MPEIFERKVLWLQRMPESMAVARGRELGKTGGRQAAAQGHTRGTSTEDEEQEQEQVQKAIRT